jgi:hypothetical protein
MHLIFGSSREREIERENPSKPYYAINLKIHESKNVKARR